MISCLNTLFKDDEKEDERTKKIIDIPPSWIEPIDIKPRGMPIMTLYLQHLFVNSLFNKYASDLLTYPVNS